MSSVIPYTHGLLRQAVAWLLALFALTFAITSGVLAATVPEPLKVTVVDGSVTVTGGTEEDLRHEIVRAHTELRGRRDAKRALEECKAALGRR